jgi:hypothetical protein
MTGDYASISEITLNRTPDPPISDSPPRAPPQGRIQGSASRVRPVPMSERQAGLATIARVLLAVRRRKLTLLAFVLVIPLSAALALHRITPRYTASGTIMYDPSAYAVQELQSILHA